MGAHGPLDQLMPELIKTVGGTWKRDQDGAFWQVSFDDFTVEAEPFIRQPKPSHRSLGFDCSVGHGTFGELVNHIAGASQGAFVSLRWFQHQMDASSELSPSKTLERLMWEVLEIAKSKPIEALVDDFEVNRPDSPSVSQLCHLAALAWRARVAQLLDYQAALDAGKRLNFVPMITGTMVERALDEALKRAS